MRPTLALTLLALMDTWILDVLQHFFYPGLLAIFVIASLGAPIPEDIPLILAGFMIRKYPEVASWQFAVPVALVGIMSGDVILYTLGKRWGRDIFSHRMMSWLITPQRLAIMDERFHRWGVWACFFGRFMMGVRAMMCITAGVTRFPFWKFFLADLAGAILSAPLFMILGYWFADALPLLEEYVGDAQIVIGIVVVLIIGAIVLYEVRRMRKIHREAAGDTTAVQQSTDAAGAAAEPSTQANSDSATRERAADRPTLGGKKRLGAQA